MATRNGVGKELTADTDGDQVSLYGAHGISVYNSGSNTVYLSVDSTVATLVAAIAAGTALPLPGGQSYTFGPNDHPSFNTLEVATASDTSAVKIAAS